MMSADSPEEAVPVTYENIRSFIRDHQHPVVTAGEVANHFDISNQAALYRLGKLEEKGEIVGKEAGASAKVWFLIS